MYQNIIHTVSGTGFVPFSRPIASKNLSLHDYLQYSKTKINVKLKNTTYLKTVYKRALCEFNSTLITHTYIHFIFSKNREESFRILKLRLQLVIISKRFFILITTTFLKNTLSIALTQCCRRQQSACVRMFIEWQSKYWNRTDVSCPKLKYVLRNVTDVSQDFLFPRKDSWLRNMSASHATFSLVWNNWINPFNSFYSLRIATEWQLNCS